MKCIGPRQQGLAAIAAIFLVVVLAALGGFMVTFSNTQQFTSAQDLMGSRAYWAARAGLEWGIGSVTANSVCPASPTNLTIDVFTVTVNCGSQAYTEAPPPPSVANNVTIYQFTSVAKSAGSVGSIGYIERSVSATMEQ